MKNKTGILTNKRESPGINTSNNLDNKTTPTPNKKRNDLILIISIVLIAVFCLIGYYLFFHRTGAYAVVSVNGTSQPDMTFPLDTDTTVELTGYIGGHNMLCIKDGYAFITDADCPDKLCQKQKKIRYSGETIVCLPHRIVISIIADEDNGIDGIVS